jgi:AraC-like DNA-binding protein
MILMSGVVFYRDAGLGFFELKSCSIDALTYKKHAHAEYSLGFIKRGRTELWYEGKKVDIEQEKFVIIPPNGLHACTPFSADKWQYNMLYIEADWLERLPCGTLFRKDRPVVHSMSQADKRRMAGLMQLFTSSISPLAKETAMISCLMNIFANTEQITASYLEHSYEQTKLRKVQEYLQEHYLEKITLDDLEQVAGLNKFYLVRLFKKEFNISPHAYQTLQRINFAKKELRINQPLAQVAAKLGFYDQSHFTKAFKCYVGATPETYRKSSGKNQFFTIQS